MNDYLQQPLVLVIDDDPDVLGEVATALAHAGYASHCCGTVETAIQSARSTAPDLIICDTSLDGHSGLWLCQQIKQDDALRNVPVMFLSDGQSPDVIRRTHDIGGTYYLRKPFETDVLMELVDKALWTPELVRRPRAVAPAVGSGRQAVKSSPVVG